LSERERERFVCQRECISVRNELQQDIVITIWVMRYYYCCCYTHTQTYPYTHKQTQAHTKKNRKHKHKHTHTRTDTHTHANTHTRTYTHWRWYALQEAGPADITNKTIWQVQRSRGQRTVDRTPQGQHGADDMQSGSLQQDWKHGLHTLQTLQGMFKDMSDSGLERQAQSCVFMKPTAADLKVFGNIVEHAKSSEWLGIVKLDKNNNQAQVQDGDAGIVQRLPLCCDKVNWEKALITIGIFADAYMNRGQFRKNLHWLTLSLEIARQIEPGPALLRVGTSLMRISVGQVALGRFELAVANTQQAIFELAVANTQQAIL